MKVVLGAVLGLVGTGLCVAPAAFAADCRTCSKLSSVAQCIACVPKHEGSRYTLEQRTWWCNKNQPLCYGRAKKK